MPLGLDTGININDSVSSFKINSFAIDLDKAEIHVAYSELNSSDQVIAQKTLTIIQPDYTQAIIDANTTAGTDVYSPLKDSLYNQLSLATGHSGVVS